MLVKVSVTIIENMTSASEAPAQWNVTSYFGLEFQLSVLFIGFALIFSKFNSQSEAKIVINYGIS